MKHWKKKLPEKDIQKQCIDYLRFSGWYIVENYKNKKPRVLGISDITAIKKGRTVWIEFKTLIGKQSKEQIEFEQNIKLHGGDYILINDFDKLADYLKDTRQGELFENHG